MRKLLAATLAGVTFAGAVAAASPASADRRHYRHHHRGNDGDVAAAAIIAGVAGLALGSALSSNNRGNRGYYSYGTGYSYDPRYDYYGGSYYGRPYPPRYAYSYRTCTRTERFYDPYYGRHVKVRREYPC